DRIGKAKTVTTRAQIKALHQAVQNYMLDTGSFPDASTGLEALVIEPPDVTGWNENGYLDGVLAVPRDAWNRDFIYQVPGEYSPSFDIISYGADGEEGGEGENADIFNSDVRGVTTE
ncbi:MAG: type II secretion system major pseudopilin GspG, partial [Alphaproteobacteria bacterium]